MSLLYSILKPIVCKVVNMINNIPVLILMLALVIPAAVLGMRAAEKLLKKQAALLN